MLVPSLYTVDFKGSIDKQEQTITLSKPFRPDLDLLVQVAERVLFDEELSTPSTEPSIKKKKDTDIMRWSELSHSITISGQLDEPKIIVIVRRRGLLTQMMRVHRAEAGSAFKVLSLILVAGLLLLFASGFYMVHSLPRFRKSYIYLACQDV